MAASNFLWESVAAYDFMFRQLMAEKPWQSWAKTYTQGWNLTLKSGHDNSHQTNKFGAAMASHKEHGAKDDYCWKYNFKKCKKTSGECNYEHKCSYCGGWNHGYFNCHKCGGRRSLSAQGGGQSAHNSSSPPSSTQAKK